jgi:hypothetical protein
MTARRTRQLITANVDLPLSTAQHDSTERMPPKLAADPIESIDPTDPIDRIEPTDPIERIDPLEPIDRIEPREWPLPVCAISPSSTLGHDLATWSC